MTNPSVKTYCVTFGVVEVNIAAVVQYLFDSADILAFWNYVPLVYCVKSRLSARDLAVKLKSFFPQTGPYLIAEINPQNVDGILPNEAWEWFYLDHHQKTHAPTFHFPPTLEAPKSS
ncbi:hypothetical protein [Bradyrhizobium diazoefficiens]|uniref:Uncharacterized protein n=1 Tax=Bradyrhizobium diazoefficiens TaxID=1355477 RepID=A0A809YH43_9BRAD|nr:hypothetical protein [Bradyrhizobium diazoefficiens]BCA04156.1 hypothetical protein H12S4_50600 [Bradyrhizobium diazoefficiens]BCA21513.1 hypothetical protein BDHH15_47280 [Bradyrhizobium diazoefficiens]BCE39682.1 hypothetical protein XF3B_47130 [Bradyrhizobium diazoefficiens]BCF53078.1 hypothetical protein XF17B_47160 [Bradyrhizobium diazoefficiens]